RRRRRSQEQRRWNSRRPGWRWTQSRTKEEVGKNFGLRIADCGFKNPENPLDIPLQIRNPKSEIIYASLALKEQRSTFARTVGAANQTRHCQPRFATWRAAAQHTRPGPALSDSF